MWPYQAPVAARGGRDASHARTAHFPVAAVITASRGHSPWSVLSTSLVVTFDALLGAMSSDIGRHLPIIARGRLPAHLYGVEHDCLVASDVLGDDAAWLLKCSSEEVALFALSRALLTVTG
jgi:hypothetical protein